MYAIKISSWEEGRNLCKWFGNGSIFRGQEKESWPLQTTIERAGKNLVKNSEDLARIERRIIGEFAKRANLYFKEEFKPICLIDLLSIIQHHGGPTRLLDFTYSFYIACFFALSAIPEEENKSDAAVWAISKEPLMFKAKQTILPIIVNRQYDKEPSIAESWEEFEKYYFADGYPTNNDMIKILEDSINSEKKTKTIVPVEPMVMFPRFSIQQGIFVAPGDLSVSFEECLRSTAEIDEDSYKNPKVIPFSGDEEVLEEILFSFQKDKVIKIILPSRLHKEIIDDLWAMNINASSLFPGLDGFAKSMIYYARQKEGNEENNEKRWKIYSKVMSRILTS